MSDQGWFWPSNSKKAHYYSGGRSLCGRWAQFGSPALEPGKGGGPDDCASCARKASALHTNQKGCGDEPKPSDSD